MFTEIPRGDGYALLEKREEFLEAISSESAAEEDTDDDPRAGSSYGRRERIRLQLTEARASIGQEPAREIEQRLLSEDISAFPELEQYRDRLKDLVRGWDRLESMANRWPSARTMVDLSVAILGAPRGEARLIQQQLEDRVRRIKWNCPQTGSENRAPRPRRRDVSRVLRRLRRLEPELYRWEAAGLDRVLDTCKRLGRSQIKAWVGVLTLVGLAAYAVIGLIQLQR